MKTLIHNQLVKITHHAIVPAVALALLAAPAANAALVKFTPGAGESFSQNVIITQGTTGNGSFEANSISDWLANFGATIDAVTSGPTPAATDGSYSGRIFETGTAANVSRVTNTRDGIGLDFVNGDVFRITFDYYVPSTDGYTQLIINPVTQVGTSDTTSGNIENINPISTFDSWVSVDLYWQLDTDDGFNGLDTRFEFRRSSPLAGTTYEGFIDNVVITQGILIPEPSSLALFALAALSFIGLGKRNRILRSKSSSN